MKRIILILNILSVCYLINAQTLEKTYGNKYFSLNYPDNWEIVQEDNRATSNVNISVQVMEKKVNNVDFLPNVNIIKSAQKRTENTANLASLTLNQIKSVLPQVQSVRTQSVTISGCTGTLIEYEGVVNGYSLHWFQYIIKKTDNTTFTITCTLDNNKLQSQKKIADLIVKSIIIK